jgi:hypothetical protein
MGLRGRNQMNWSTIFCFFAITCATASAFSSFDQEYSSLSPTEEEHLKQIEKAFDVEAELFLVDPALVEESIEVMLDKFTSSFNLAKYSFERDSKSQCKKEQPRISDELIRRILILVRDKAFGGQESEPNKVFRLLTA